MRFRLLRCLAKALAKNGVKFLCGLVPGGDVLFDIAADAWHDYREGRPRDGLRTELGELAQAPAAEVQQEAQDAAQTAAAHLPADAQQRIVTYLSQVPGMIRRSLRRPSDPTGTTVPADLPLRSPEDLLSFLPPSPPRFQAGMRPLPGVDWVLEEPLGVGGFGEVWKARHAHLKSKPPVALKFCLDPSAARVLRNEAGVLDRLMQHGRQQGIVPLLDAYLNADPPCLVYEYVEGGDLTGLIRELHAQGGLTVVTANRLLLRLADIIAAAHRANPAIVHDDLKPSNILIRRAAEGLKLYVTDYGIGGLAVARAVRQTQRPTNSREQLLTEAVRGSYTPLYASLEQMTRRRDEPPDPRDDVHALGVIWYQLVTGDLTMLRIPVDWTDELHGRGLSEELIGLLGTCLASKAEKRPASAGVLAVELRALTTPTAKPGPPQRPAPASQPQQKLRKPSKPERHSVWRQPVPWVAQRLAALKAIVARRNVWRQPVLWVVLSVLLLGPVAVGLVTTLNHPWPGLRFDNSPIGGERPPDVRAMTTAGRRALTDGDFDLGVQLLQSALDQDQQHAGTLSPNERRDLTQLWRQGDLLARLSSRPLEQIVAEADLVRHDEEWKAQFAANYLGRTIVFDDEVRFDAAQRDDGRRRPLLRYRVTAAGREVRLALEDLSVLQSLPLERPQRMLFGGRLSAVERGSGGQWVVRFDADSGVLLTDRGAAEAACPAPLDPALPDVLKRQTEWVGRQTEPRP